MKLSALHPRYEYLQRDRVVRELAPKLADLVRQARAAGIALTVDAEEADRLELSLQLIDIVLANEVTEGYGGFGLARPGLSEARLWRAAMVGPASPRCASAGSRVRLVKGAYWDSGDQTRAGTRARGLSGLHPQDQYRRLLPGLRAPAGRGTRM